MGALRSVKKVDRVRYEPLPIAVSKARALLWTLEQLGEGAAGSVENTLLHAFGDAPDAEETRAWVHGTIAETLRDTLDEIEQEYRKLGTEGRLMLRPTVPLREQLEAEIAGRQPAPDGGA